ncbi:MAG: DUF192 domain-containing protein [Candidatus Binataceae bacterium]
MRSYRLLAVLALIVTLAACARGPRIEIVAPDGSRHAAVSVEIADTKDTRDLGLMYRPHLDEYAGMLFVFPEPARQQFWMKNTEIALDMIFADPAGKIVGIVPNAVPYSQDLLFVDAPSQYVLEVNAGFCKSHGVRPGDRLQFAGFAPRSRD